MPSLAIYLPNLASGGAERVHIGLASAFIAAGWDVTFLLQHAEGAFLDAVPKGAHIVSLNRKHTLTSLMPLVRYVKKEKPDILYSNFGHNNIVAIWAVALAHTRTRVIASQQNTLSWECQQNGTWRYRILPLLYRIFLRYADGIVCVSQGVAHDLAHVTGIAIRRLSVITNPVVFYDFAACLNAPVSHPWLTHKQMPVLIAAGRLHAQKDFFTLISAFALVLKQRTAKLIIMGEGPMRGELLAHATALGIAEHLDMPGFIANPLPLFRAADMLVMSSRYEGFGNVLAEALACGTSVVSTDCPHGPSEILAAGKFGRLVPVGDAHAMAEAIWHTLDAPLAKDMLEARGREFTSERAAESYVRLFETVMATQDKV